MAYPTVASIGTGNDGSNTTSHTVNMPSGTVSGNLIIAALAMDGNTTYGWPAGWNVLSPITNSAGDGTLEARYKISDGTEGASITVTTAGSEAGSHKSFRITNWHGTQPPEAGSPATGTGISPDPASATASWGSEENLFLIVMSMGTSQANVDAWPTNYTDNQTQDAVSNAAIGGIGMATRNLTSNTDNPGTATLGVTTGWVANTLVVRPAGAGGGLAQPIFSKEIQSVLFGGQVVH